MNSLPPFQLGHVALVCSDLTKIEEFYCEVLGYRVVWRPDPDNCYLTRGGDSLALHSASQVERVDRESRLDHFGFILKDAQDVHRWADHIRSHNVALDGGVCTHRDGSTSFYVRDPEGNRVQFLHLGPGMTTSD